MVKYRGGFLSVLFANEGKAHCYIFVTYGDLVYHVLIPSPPRDPDLILNHYTNIKDISLCE
jgi:hypothetical protein